MKQNQTDYKELLKEQLRQVADKVDAVNSTEAAYIAGRLDAMLATEQLSKIDAGAK